MALFGKIEAGAFIFQKYMIKNPYMRGVILAGGKGTRLLPATKITNKHLIPIINHPMVLYPLRTLKSFGIKDILLVSGGDHIGDFAEFLGDGSAFGINLTYKVQREAGGIAQALGLAEDFVRGDTHDPQFAVALGDNILGKIQKPPSHDGATIFLKKVPDPQRFGVALFREGKLAGVVEKPKHPPSNSIVIGIYLYPRDVFNIIETLKPSKRGELEIAEVNDVYIKQGRCMARNLSSFWSDAGTPASLAQTTRWALTKGPFAYSHD